MFTVFDRAVRSATVTLPALAFLWAVCSPPAFGQQNQPLPSYAEPGGQGAPQESPMQPGSGQSDSETGSSEGGPAPGVARISDLLGTVDVKRADTGDTFAAALNAPVNLGDYLTTRDDSRAELEFAYGTDLRVAPDTQIRFGQLEENAAVTQLAEGTLELRVFRGLEAHPVVETPAATITPEERGRYRISVTEDGDTKLAVREGHADVAVADGSVRQTIAAGSAVVVRGQGPAARIDPTSFAVADDFERWNDERDARWQHPSNDSYVDEGMVGANDLDLYGRWSDDPTYGEVWQPNDVPAGWSPYSDGRWAWEPYYGWTWIGYEPWGWAPYHYGRWFYGARGWSWFPGRHAAGPYAYAPALVNFFSFDLAGNGFGGGFGNGFGGGFGNGFGNIGWLALAPFEALHPWWGVLFGLGTSILSALFNFSVQNNQNFNAPGGIVAVGRGDFANGNFGGLWRPHSNELRHLTVARGIVPVIPTQRSLGFNGRDLSPVPSASSSTRFAQLPEPRHVPEAFAAQRAAVENFARRAYPDRAEAFADEARNSRSSESVESTPHSAWDRFDSGNAYRSPPRAIEPSNSPWDRFNGSGGSAYRASSDRTDRAGRSADAEARGYGGESRAYSRPSYASGYSQQHYSERGYTPDYYAHSYSRPTYDGRTYSRPSYDARSYSQPSYSARSYSRPSYNARSYARQSSSAPSRGYTQRASSSARGFSSGGGNHGSRGSDGRHDHR